MFARPQLHVHPATIQLALACKPRNRLTFITDAVAPPVIGTKIAYETRVMEVIKCSDYLPAGSIRSPDEDGACVVLEGTKTLAGSAATLHDVFKRLVTWFGLPLNEASQVCSETPAAIAGLTHVGRLTPGCRADCVLLNSDYNVERVFVAGQQL